MKANQIQNSCFRTSSFNLGVYLLCKGLKLVAIEKSDSQRKTFLFEDEPHCKKLVEVFNFAEENHADAIFDIRKVFLVSRELKNKLYLE